MRKATVRELAEIVDGRVEGDGDQVITGIQNLSCAVKGDISFLSNARYARYLGDTQATAVIVNAQDNVESPATLILVKDPYLAYAKIANYLTTPTESPQGIHPQAVVHETAKVHETACVSAGAVIEADAEIAAGVYIGTNCYIGEKVYIGQRSYLHPNVCVYARTQLGKNALIHCGAVLGSDGFGLANENGEWIKIPQIGQLIVGDNVEIGANTTIDRGAIDNTIIHDGVKIDNLVHVAHNVEIGEHTAIAACVGIAGSAKIGKYCTIAGIAGINGHIDIADKVHIGAMAMVTKSIKEPGHYASGLPAEPTAQWRRNVVRFRQLDKLEKRIKELESEIKSLKGL